MMKPILCLTALFSVLAGAVSADTPQITGDYLEARTCNVYAGSCFVNGEMGLTGKEAILVWSVQTGSWKGTRLDGLKVIAALAAHETLGDQQARPVSAQAVLVVDERAGAEQKAALTDLAQTLGGKLISHIVEVRSAEIEVILKTSGETTTATVKAGNILALSTLGITKQKTPCGNAEIWYPPLTEVVEARAGFTALAAYYGLDLNRTWEATNLAGSYIAKFSR
jgi:hypothetical protein